MSGSSISSRISTVEITNIVERLKHEQYRDSTKKNYYAVWRVFSKFFINLDYRPQEWEDRLTLFVGYLIHKKHQSSTVKSYISAIKAMLKEDNVKISEDQYLLASLTKVCRIHNDQIQTRLPIKKGLLSILLSQTDTHFTRANQPYLQLMFKTIFITMYYGLLRVSEVSTGGHPILAGDVHIGTNKRKFLLVLHTSKTHGKNMKPQLVKISATKMTKQMKNSQLTLPCPFELLRSYAKYRGNFRHDTDAFFVLSDGTPVSPKQLRDCLRMIVKDAGFDASLYSMHSLRIGRTYDLFKLGLTVETIKKLR